MSKYDIKFKRRVIQICLKNDVSVVGVARDYGVDYGLLRQWVNAYRHHGESSLKPKQVQHSLEFKLKVLQQLRRGGVSRRQLAARFDIRSISTITYWERQYNAGTLGPTLPSIRKRSVMVRKSSERPPKPSNDERSREQLLEELEYLRAENAYLKKLDALIREQRAAQAKKRKPSKD